MYELEPAIAEFERAFGCRVMIHCHGREFRGADGELLFPRVRLSHRQSCPELCGRLHTRDYCPERHYRKLPALALREPERRAYVVHCRKGVVEVASPLFVERNHVATVYAGAWARPLPGATIRRLMTVLPVWAAGLLTRAGELRRGGVAPAETRREKIAAFVAMNYSKPVRTGDLAAKLYLSTIHTCHLVKRLFGVSFSELLMNERMSRARAMLANSQLSVGAIAELCGFGSSEQFSRMFRRRTGQSPRQFRRSSEQ